MIPRNRLLYCRYLDPVDTLPGGRIALLDGSLRAITAQQGIVEAVSAGGLDTEGDFVPMDERLKPGAWILHKGFTRTESPLPHDHQHFVVHEDDVVAVLA